MTIYKLTLKPKSSFITPLQSDTLWGTFCWALKYLKGNKDLEDFISCYFEKPPLIISDGIPEGYLPKPILPPLELEACQALAKKFFGENKSDIVKGLKRIKELRKQRYISLHIFEALKENLSEKNILQKLLEQGQKDRKKEHQPDIKSMLVFRNTIDRVIGAVKREGGLHPNEEIFFNPEIKINIFLKTDYFNLSQLQEIFTFIALSGFGKSASSGKGALELVDCKKETIFFSTQSPNAFMSISSFVPESSNPVRGYFQIITKWGKLGGEYAKSRIPFKKPLVMFSAGSIFFDSQIKEYYGRLIENICRDEKIKHYGYAFPVGVRINENL